MVTQGSSAYNFEMFEPQKQRTQPQFRVVRNKKLERISYAENLIVDLIMHVKEDKKFYFDTTVNFRWGGNAHVTGDDFDFAAALNKMMDVLDTKIKKEKDKVQEKK